jgi:hypothetical protein
MDCQGFAGDFTCMAGRVAALTTTATTILAMSAIRPV